MLKTLLLVSALLLSPLTVMAENQPSSALLYTATFAGVAGQTVNLAELRGKVAVVNFWATWCPPCRKEMPDLVAAYAKYQGQGVAFVGIAVEDDVALVTEFARAHDVNFPLATGKESGIALMQALGNRVAGLPYTVVLDASGNVVATKRGPIKPARLEQVLQEAIGTSGAAAN